MTMLYFASESDSDCTAPRYRLRLAWSAQRIIGLLLIYLTAPTFGTAGETKQLVAEDQAQWPASRFLQAPEAHQAAAADELRAFVVSSTEIAVYERATGQRLSVTRCGDAEHLNSAFLHEGLLYCAHSNHPQLPEQSDIRVFDPNTLSCQVFRSFGQSEGSLTWAVYYDQSWWCFFAFYQQDNARSYLARYDPRWRETGRWLLPESVVERLGKYSLSGGIWLDDELLVTGHDDPLIFRLRLPAQGDRLELIAVDQVPFAGQGFALDPASGGLVGIQRKQRRVVFADPPADRRLRLRVLSYNIHHGEGMDGLLDLRRIGRVILSVNPDLVSVQEVDQGATRSGRVDQPAALAEQTALDQVFGGNIPLQGGQYGNVILSRFPITRSHNHPLPNVDQGEQRGLLDASIELPGGRTELRFLATHLDHRRSDRERRLSAELIERLVRDAPHQATLLAGDLNDRLGSPTLETLLRVFSIPNTGELPTIPVNQPARQIDFILYRPAEQWRVVETRVLDEAVASDHRALLSVLELRPR